jgi:hypothetical protein
MWGSDFVFNRGGHGVSRRFFCFARLFVFSRVLDFERGCNPALPFSLAGKARKGISRYMFSAIFASVRDDNVLFFLIL